MKASIARHLGVERGAEKVSLFDRDDSLVRESGKNPNGLPHGLDNGGADEDSVNGRLAENGYI